MHTICTQYAHNMHTICTHTNTEHNTEQTQYPEQNLSTEQHTCTHTEQHTENRTQDTTICSAHNYRTYSFDFYHLQQYINKSYTKVVSSSKLVVGYFCVNYSVSENYDRVIR